MDDPTQTSLADMRVNYAAGTLSLEELAEDPFLQFKHWMSQAHEFGVPEPNAMTLSTLGVDQIPSSRTVLLKGLDDRGFSFFTNYNSRKAREIEAHPAASLLFLWKELERQVIVRGRVEVVAEKESETYFKTRPYDSRIGAWASEQSTPIPNREWLEERFKGMRIRFPDDGTEDCVPLPDFWGGYRVLPMSLEFWQGGAGRLHDRFIYSRDGAGWKIERLSP